MDINDFKKKYANTDYLKDLLREVADQKIESYKFEQYNDVDYITIWTKDKVIWADFSWGLAYQSSSGLDIDCIEIRSIDRNP